MMSNYIPFILAISALLANACTKEPVATGSNVEITFIPSLVETKANLIGDDLTVGDVRIHLDGYLNGKTDKHLNGNVLYEDSKWIFYTHIKDVHYYWPQNSNLDVLAYSPAKLDSTHITTESKTVVKCKNLPMVDSLQADKHLDEFICGYKANCSKEDGAINITLHRPYAAINFYLDEAIRSTLNYIKIENLYSTGNYTCSESGGSWGSLTDSAYLYCKVNKVYPININNGSHLGGPFLVIPQALPDAVKLIFSYRSTGNSKDTITETTLGKAALVSGGTVGQWEPGKVFNYWISLNGAANEIRMAVTINEWKTEGNTEIDVK